MGTDNQQLINLYSFQPWPVIEQAFADHGSYTPSAALAKQQDYQDNGDNEWWNALQPAYQWIISEMTRRGLSQPSEDATPLWAWMQWVDSQGNVRREPDRNDESFESDRDSDLIHLRIPADRVLLTDFEAFHWVINNWPLAPKESTDWTDEQYDKWLDEHWDDSPEQKQQQWPDRVIVTPDDLPHRWVQACVWTIAPDDVISVNRVE
ncbi:DUF3841 domain-containing protein [Bifidobacterium callitrichidarum]|uniref:DUF3841 domain-containing protein n=1 Tax=Bifidobacterium callitrichidarum TaxID=2052941 RepID=UPI001F4D4631|nr:DUF3841 domain-containing protein [Bifidobacterium callitrichidarum]